MRTLRLGLLWGEERLVLLLYYWSRMTEREIAAELNELTDTQYTRDRIHTIRLAAERQLRADARTGGLSC